MAKAEPELGIFPRLRFCFLYFFGNLHATLSEILRLTEGTLAPVACLDCGAAPCNRAAQCKTLPVWTELDRIINSYLDSVAIADLLQKQPGKRSVNIRLANTICTSKGCSETIRCVLYPFPGDTRKTIQKLGESSRNPGKYLAQAGLAMV